ncbi:30S ribosomal protein S4 [Roseisolibacter sp. H3M3-2]|uniref:30S ribosomal protein S4 n=1 Tax=Roseisolibacter sp. H3M3-2 TaxID=3031323 RepID=UPI0023DCE24E|nr:30S ribosomal protein S4 [Roseisolibacter sp. H3M3-2]MDF1503740.1 30S ribosomal protein S4 [Roseisolibacter sp. H3M3-2]
MPVRTPRLKILRRFGVALPGLTRKDHERRPYPPGQHGQSQSRRRKVSEFRKLLEEKQKVRFNYGVSESQFRRYFANAQRMAGRTGENLLALLERRLDNVVFRLGFAPTIPAARQLVAHGHVRVNGKRVDRASYSVAPGETVSLPPGRVRERPSILEAVERGPQLRLPSYLALDPDDKFVGRVIATPARADVPFPIEESKIVEFYAR